MIISSRLQSRLRDIAFRTSSHGIVRTIRHRQLSQQPPQVKASVRSAPLRPTASRTDEESKNLAKDSALSIRYWSSPVLWERASVNTLRCLAFCALGDFSTMWYLQSQYPSLGIYLIMGISMTAGVTTSLSMETILLRYGLDRLSWRAAATTAAGMSLVSMLSMEAVQNLVDYHLMGGIVDLRSPAFWAAAGVSACAGFLTPLPYNYMRLRKYGKGCH